MVCNRTDLADAHGRADLFLKLSKDTNTNRSSLYFYDTNIKANYKLGEKDHIYLSGYFGKDKLGLGNTFGFDYGNATVTFRWNHILSSRLFSNTSLIYSKYDYNIKINSGIDVIDHISSLGVISASQG